MSHDLELSPDERTYLLDLLRQEQGRLKAEVHHTQTRDYKEALRAHENVLNGLIARLEAGQTA